MFESSNEDETSFHCSRKCLRLATNCAKESNSTSSKSRLLGFDNVFLSIKASSSNTSLTFNMLELTTLEMATKYKMSLNKLACGLAVPSDN